MRLIDQHTAEDYLRETGRLEPGEQVRICELSGGVSNMVLLVERPDRPGHDFVLKQARAQLRTEQPWFASIERIWREADVLQVCQQLLERSDMDQYQSLGFGTPQILFKDRQEYLFAMAAAPRPNVVWKTELLAGRVEGAIAAAAGALLGTLHAESWQNSGIAAQLGDRTLFDQLRIDPYYRTLAETRPEARAGIERLLASLDSSPRSLVHADFSPKNLLVFSGGLMMVDFETGHFGDPAFDLGFFLSHLLLKACLNAPEHARYLDLTERFRSSYDQVLAPRIPAEELASLWTRGMQNLAGCAWARIDGKSPVEYLNDPQKREVIRGLSREVFDQKPSNWADVVQFANDAFSVFN